MNLAYFRFYEELNEFLSLEKRKEFFPYSFNGNPSVKDAIEALGVPHVEVDLIRLFTRCMECNGILADVSKKDIMYRLLPKTRQYYQKFTKCPDCDRIYWVGSHYEKMKEYIASLIKVLK
ncbi:MAG: Mut7-C RNAse domain-containing protein [Bacteroidales bacterium]|nr:Mut7-C RNAse domain-containing protein [Bacteroidales bacterium]